MQPIAATCWGERTVCPRRPNGPRRLPVSRPTRSAAWRATTRRSSRRRCCPAGGRSARLYGEQIARAFITLACLSGNVGIRGWRVGQRGHALERSSRSGACLRARTRRPAVARPAWASDILEDRLDPPLEMAYIVASNLINRSPDTRAQRAGAGAARLRRRQRAVSHADRAARRHRPADLHRPGALGPGDVVGERLAPRLQPAGRRAAQARRGPTTGSLPNWRSGWALARPTPAARTKRNGWSISMGDAWA